VLPPYRRSNGKHLPSMFEKGKLMTKGLGSVNCLSLSFSLITNDYINRENNK